MRSARLLTDFHKLPPDKSKVHHAWKNWLQGLDQHLQITFDPTCSGELSEASLINLLHPLVRQAAAAMTGTVSNKSPRVTSCIVQDDSIPAGQYPFALYEWQYHGLREDVRLQGISTDPQIAERIMELLKNGEPVESHAVVVPSPEVLEELESKHHETWSAAKADHHDYVVQLSEHRRESLDTSHAARVGSLNEKLQNVTEEKIRRMLQGQLNNAATDYQKHCTDLDGAAAKAEITMELVAIGTIQVIGS